MFLERESKKVKKSTILRARNANRLVEQFK